MVTALNSCIISYKCGYIILKQYCPFYVKTLDNNTLMWAIMLILWTSAEEDEEVIWVLLGLKAGQRGAAVGDVIIAHRDQWRTWCELLSALGSCSVSMKPAFQLLREISCTVPQSANPLETRGKLKYKWKLQIHSTIKIQKTKKYMSKLSKKTQFCIFSIFFK